MSTAQLYTGAQINSGDLTPYLTYGFWAGGEKQRGLLNSVQHFHELFDGRNVANVFDAIRFAGFLTTAPSGIHPTATPLPVERLLLRGQSYVSRLPKY
jgi:hypothetical protein